jgi:L-threonylcarbamoyladenylate synthase
VITKSIEKAKAALEEGSVIAIPTETVYGLAANIFDEQAIRSIFEIKKRPLDNPLIVHLAGIDRLSEVVTEIPKAAQKLADQFWPGPLTLLLPKSEKIPDIVSAGLARVGVRVPDHAVTLDLLSKLDFPLAAPSANPFKRISPTTAAQVDAYFGDQLKVILDGGECKRGLESTIVGFENEEAIIYRLGSVTKEAIEACLGSNVELKNKKDSAPDSPGMLLKHYSPRTPMILSDKIEQSLLTHVDQKIGLLLFQHAIEGKTIECQIVLSERGNLEEAASKLYQAMQELDNAAVDLIVAERFPDHGLGATINDKLERASA